jgi:hypothetical protein
VKEGSSAYWLALLPINTGNPVASVEVHSASRGWQELVRADDNYWIAASGMGVGPFTVRITDTLGHAVTLTGIALGPGAVQTTGLDMYGTANSVPAPSNTAAPTSSPARTSTRPSATRRGKSQSAGPPPPWPVAPRPPPL